MSIADFQIAYDGEAVRAGSMDVRDLAPALLAVGDLVSQANVILNGDRATASVRVESDFKRSSFEISLLLHQSLIDQARGLFKHTVVDADTLVIEICIKNAMVSAKRGEVPIGGCSPVVSSAISVCDRWNG